MKKNFTIRQELIRALSYKQIHFLIKHKVFSIYLENTINYLITCKSFYLEPMYLTLKNQTFTSIKEDSGFIAFSFSWCVSRQKYIFWEKLNKLYYEK